MAPLGVAQIREKYNGETKKACDFAFAIIQSNNIVEFKKNFKSLSALKSLYNLLGFTNLSSVQLEIYNNSHEKFVVIFEHLKN